jgi:hypothetical protein
MRNDQFKSLIAYNIHLAFHVVIKALKILLEAYQIQLPDNNVLLMFPNRKLKP